MPVMHVRLNDKTHLVHRSRAPGCSCSPGLRDLRRFNVLSVIGIDDHVVCGVELVDAKKHTGEL